MQDGAQHAAFSPETGIILTMSRYQNRFHNRYQFYITGLLFLGLMIFGAGGCNRGGPAPAPEANAAPSQPASPSGEPPAAPAAATPTNTPLPLALRVNGFAVTLAEYQAELAQYKAALDAASSAAELSPEQEQIVLNDLIDQALLAQAAQAAGFVTFDESQAQQRSDELAAKLGGEAALQTWMQANGFDAQSFRHALQRQQAAAWMRDRILAEVPTTAEQVHARQILLYTADEAAEVLSQLKAGNDFGNLAVTYDPVTRGDLGWFPRGYLTDPKLDEIVFSLQVEQFSDVVETAAGFHILQMLERADQRPLSPEALLLVRANAIQHWLATQRGQAQIENLLP
jgi:peptidyl-prolyl cis-trans isomerase C